MSGISKLETMDVPGVRRAILRRKRFILGSIAAFGLVGLALNVLTPPRYRAVARLEVRPASDRPAWNGETRSASNFQSENVALYTDVELMTNRVLLARLAGDLNAPGSVLADREPASWMPKWLRVPMARASSKFPVSNASYSSDPLHVERQVNWLQSAIRVQPVKDTRLVDVVVEDSDPQVARAIANKLAQLNVDYQGQLAVEADTAGYGFLQNQIASVRERIDATAQELYGGSGLAEQTARAEQMRATVSGLSGAYAQAQAERVAATSRLSRLKAVGADTGDDDTGVPVGGENLSSLRRDLAATQTELVTASKVYGSEHPKLQQLKSRESQLRSQIDAEIHRSVAGLRGETAVLRSRESQLRSAVASAQGSLISAEVSAHRNAALEAELKVDQELYGRLLARAREAGFSQELSTPQIRLVSAASVDEAPVRPRPYLNLAVCLAAGCLVGVGLALVKDASRRTVQYPEDVERQLDLPVLAVLPRTA